jgi:transcription antitermination factor NusB
LRKRTQAREYALHILYQMDITGDSASAILDRFWQDNNCEMGVRDFARQLVQGSSKNLAEIDTIISKHSEHWKLYRMAAIDRGILRLATYEILYRNDIPPKATINEAVEMAHKYSTPDSGKFINGILDKIMTLKRTSLIES